MISVRTERAANPRPLVLTALLLSAATGCGSPYPPPPDTDREAVTDTIHGVEIVDHYRWLEDQDSPEVRAWLDAQNAYTDSVIGYPALRAALRDRLWDLMDDADYNGPRRAGEYEYFSMRRKGADQRVIYRRPAPDSATRIDPQADYEVVLDPTDWSPGHNTSVAIQAFSPAGRHMIYSVRDGGQDEVVVRIRDLAAGADLPDSLPNGLYSSFTWRDDESFYYSARSRQTGARIRLHDLGEEFSKDEELFGQGYGPDKFVSVSRIDDGRYLLYEVWHGWARIEIHVQDVENDGRIVTIAGPELNARFYPQFIDGELYMLTTLDAPNGRVVAVDLDNPNRENWREVIPEAENTLQSFSLIDDQFYVTYLDDVSTQIRVLEKDGTDVGGVEVPEYHSASVWGGGEGKLFLSLNSFTTLPVTYRIDQETGEREVWQQRKVPFDAAGIEVKQVWYTSKDGTRVPMFVMHREGLELTGDHPTLLYGYGGFLAALTPRFDPMAAIWVERGGVYAMANLRGGSEFGERWHRNGMLENKQNVFDDFVAAAEHLIAEGYTNPTKLAIRGYSNGGLLVMSAMTQRPDLYRAVLCGFPDLDMVRFYTFTETNNLPALHEYGNAAIPEQFEFLRKYSPYQAVKRGTKYPAVILSSGDLDTRVPPLQARKMTAILQWATGSGLPVVLRYDPKAGHAAGRGKPFSQRVEEQAEELTFLLQQLDATGTTNEY